MNRDLGPWALLLQLGWTIAISIVGSFLIGVWVYRTLNSSPLGALLFVFIALLGIIGGCVAVYRQVVRAMEMTADQQPPHKKYRRYDFDDEKRERDPYGGDYDRDKGDSKTKEDEQRR